MTKTDNTKLIYFFFSTKTDNSRFLEKNKIYQYLVICFFQFLSFFYQFKINYQFGFYQFFA